MRLKGQKGKSVAFSVTMSEELEKKLVEFAADNSMSRSGAVNLCVRKYLESVEAMPSVMDIVKNFSSVLADMSGLSREEKLARLEDVEKQSQMMQEALKK